MRWVETKLRELKRVLRALRELTDDLVVLIFAWVGLMSLILWLWPR